jgi:hypothetical protein
MSGGGVWQPTSRQQHLGSVETARQTSHTSMARRGETAMSWVKRTLTVFGS